MGSSMSKYVLPGLETAAGVGTEIIAPGNPIGLGLMGSGVGQLAGGAAGGNKGQTLGGLLGGLAGGGYGMTGAPGMSNGMSSLSSLFGGGAGNVGASAASNAIPQGASNVATDAFSSEADGMGAQVPTNPIPESMAKQMAASGTQQQQGGLGGLLNNPTLSMMLLGPLGSMLMKGFGGSQQQSAPTSPKPQIQAQQFQPMAPVQGGAASPQGNPQQSQLLAYLKSQGMLG